MKNRSVQDVVKTNQWLRDLRPYANYSVSPDFPDIMVYTTFYFCEHDVCRLYFKKEWRFLFW